jgi:hypothetical protein
MEDFFGTIQPSMKETFAVIHQMKESGVIENYAIGGAIAAMFYIDPFATEDLDIFFGISGAGDALDLLSPIYEYLKTLGYFADGAMINIEGWAVQFLPVYNPLIEEAVERAREVEYLQIPLHVISAEHLVAIMLDTGRPKDYARIARFLELDVLDRASLTDILVRHDLNGKWEEKKERFTP